MGVWRGTRYRLFVVDDEDEDLLSKFEISKYLIFLKLRILIIGIGKYLL